MSEEPYIVSPQIQQPENQINKVWVVIDEGSVDSICRTKEKAIEKKTWCVNGEIVEMDVQ